MNDIDKKIGEAACSDNRHHAHNHPDGYIACCRCGLTLTPGGYSDAGPNPHDDAADHTPEGN